MVFSTESFVTCRAPTFACVEAVMLVIVADGHVRLEADSAAKVADPEKVLLLLTVRVDRVV